MIEAVTFHFLAVCAVGAVGCSGWQTDLHLSRVGDEWALHLITGGPWNLKLLHNDTKKAPDSFILVWNQFEWIPEKFTFNDPSVYNEQQRNECFSTFSSVRLKQAASAAPQLKLITSDALSDSRHRSRCAGSRSLFQSSVLFSKSEI